MTAEALKGHFDLLLLSILASGPARGYTVIGTRRRRSRGAFDLPEGTIYPALHRLENQGSSAAVGRQTQPAASASTCSRPKVNGRWQNTRQAERNFSALSTPRLGYELKKIVSDPISVLCRSPGRLLLSTPCSPL